MKEETEIVIRLCFEVDNRIEFDSPGILLGVFEGFSGDQKEQNSLIFSEYCEQRLKVDLETPCLSLKKEFADNAKFGKDRDTFYQISALTVMTKSGLWYITTHNLSIKRIYEILGTDDVVFGILMNGNAGEKFHGRYPGYTFDMHCREDDRHIPHIHVMYHHENESSFKIEDGEMIEGTMRKKHKRRVKQIILENKEYLQKEWNRMHEGLLCDLNCGLGNKDLCLPSTGKR